jgi:endonuclease-3
MRSEAARAPRWLARGVRAPMDAATMTRVIARLRRRAPRWRTTALADVAAQTGRDPFRILVGCLLSLRTRDETTAAASARLFALAATPETMLALPRARIERTIYPVGFYRTKARVLRAVSRELLARFGGRVPSDLDALLTLPGVGRKTANLVVTFGFNLPGICVDTHVHRITNRLGFVRTATPERTEWALRAKLPRRHWIGLNDLLVAFGQNLCHPLSPRCSVCPVADLCLRVGVARAR